MCRLPVAHSIPHSLRTQTPENLSSTTESNTCMYIPAGIASCEHLSAASRSQTAARAAQGLGLWVASVQPPVASVNVIFCPDASWCDDWFSRFASCGSRKLALVFETRDRAQIAPSALGESECGLVAGVRNSHSQILSHDLVCVYSCALWVAGR